MRRRSEIEAIAIIKLAKMFYKLWNMYQGGHEGCNYQCEPKIVKSYKEETLAQNDQHTKGQNFSLLPKYSHQTFIVGTSEPSLGISIPEFIADLHSMEKEGVEAS